MLSILIYSESWINLRRVKAHLKHAKQNWEINIDPTGHGNHFPILIPVGTSADRPNSGSALPSHGSLEF